jgi:hypothetical protein
VPADFRQHRGVSDRPALEQQIACAFLHEHGRAVVTIGPWVDSKEN